MTRVFLVATAAAVVFLGAFPAGALSILYWEDDTKGTSVVPGALALSGHAGSTTTATSGPDFYNQLGSTPVDFANWDLVIFGEQSGAVYQSELGDYISNGGLVLGTTWLPSPRIPSSGFEVVMEASSEDINWDSISGFGGHELFDGVSDPISLINPSWGTYSHSWNPTGSATGIGTLGPGSAVILGNSGRTLLYGPLFDTYSDLSDGSQFVSNGIDLLLSGQDVIPEPASMTLLGIGLAGVAFRRLRKKNTEV